MWYKLAQQQNQQEENIGFEYKIIRACVVHLTKNKMSLKGAYNYPESKIATLTNKIMKKIKDKYENYNFVRKYSNDDTITKVIEPIVDEVVKYAK